MIKYVTKDFYLENYGSKFIPEDLIDIFLKKAQDEVESSTGNGIRRVLCKYIDGWKLDTYTTLDDLQDDYDILSDYEIEKLKDCICEIANFLYENNDVIKGIVTSMSTNGTSVTFSKSDIEQTKTNIISQGLSTTRFTNAYF